MSVGDCSRVIVKNLPLSLDPKEAEKLISQKCKDIGLTYTDCKLLMRKRHRNEDGPDLVSRGLCFVGFSDSEYANKFKEYYDGSYFRACKVTIEFSIPPPNEAKGPPSKKKCTVSKFKEVTADGETVITAVKGVERITKAGVSSERKHTMFCGDLSDGEEEVECDDSTEVDNMGRVVIFNLPYNVTEGSIREFCKPFGPITDIFLPLNNDVGNTDQTFTGDKFTKGYCFVTWMFPSDAIKFRDTKNRSIFCGRIIHINLAKPKPKFLSPAPADKMGQRAFRNGKLQTPYKKSLEKKRKEGAENVQIWNTLHIDINSALSAVAKRLEMEKKDITHESSAAINVALSETYVLNKLKEWLEEQGVNYHQYEVAKEEEDLESVTTRSDDTIIIKNLPQNSAEVELLEMFRKYGELIRFSLSPFRVMGIVQFFNSASAKFAFNALSYKFYAGLPLYLEWAPIKLFHEDFVPPPLPEIKTDAEESKLPKDEQSSDEIQSEHENELHTSIYLKNLSFKTRDEDLHKHFGSCKGYVSSKVIMKDNARLSMGFGFVEFDSMGNAKNAIREKIGTLIDGKLVEMSISKQHREAPSKIMKTKFLKASTKIVVKNLAFQATKQELYKLFSYCGNVKSIRIPKNLKNQSRGFAFVEFMGRSDCISAFESLKNTHLYGRHLVLEFVQDKEDEHAVEQQYEHPEHHRES